MKASESLRAQAWVVVTVFITLRALMKPAMQPPSKRQELLPGPLLNSRHLHQSRLQRPIHILGPPRNQQPRSLTCALPSTRCARRSSPASRAAHFSRSSSSWRSAGARLCSAASSPRCHRLRRTEGHYACTAHERSLYSPVFAAASPASTQLPRTLIPQVASGCSGTNIYTAEPA